MIGGEMRIILTLCAVAALTANPLAGQAPAPDWPLAPDSRVRILSPALGKRFVTGSVVSATPDTLVFRLDKQSTSTAISTSSIREIGIARGTHTNTGRTGFAGFLVGALVGSSIGAATHPQRCTNCLDFGQQTAALAGGLAGGVIGALVGVAIGKRPSDTWVPVTVPAR
jgi:hypothetical protein